MLGKVVAIGEEVSKFKVGDIIGVGCYVDSCLNCPSCDNNDEQYCYTGMTGTYGTDVNKYGRVPGNQSGYTFGGYSGSHTCHEHFVIKIPSSLPIEAAAPLLCAGITMYSPLNHWGATEKKMTIGIIGIGGLGTMG